MKSGTWAVSNGVLAQSSTQLAELLPPMNYQRVYVATEVEIGQMPSGGRIGACSGQTGNNSDYDCCDLVIDGNGSQRVEAASTSGGQIRNPWSGSYATGARVAIVQDTLGSTNTCNFRQAATTAMATSTKDGANAQLILWSDSATASFRYLFVVQIGN